MNLDDRRAPPAELKVIPVWLVAGGIVGAVTGLALNLRFVAGSRMRVFSPIVVVFMALFGWSVWTGIELWQGKRRALRWAKILFAMQIPASPGGQIRLEFRL